MPNPLCFVLMPFGRKPDEAGRMIDFDAVYEQIIAPAVAAAGLEIIRADEEHVGGAIHKPMFERLILCDYAIADLTGANPNVFYELGIRHAVKPRTTLILFAEGTRLPFDVALLRGMPYTLDAAGGPASPAAASAAIAKRLEKLRNEPGADSPLFQLVEGMPHIEVDHEKTDVFRHRAVYSRTFKENLAVARAQGPDAVRAVAANVKDPAHEEAGVLIDLYLSFRDVKLYDDMLVLYERMPKPVQRTRMVQEQRGFALNRLGRGTEAARVLKEVIADFGPSSETCGLLGRVYKDRWETAVKAGDKSHARGALREAKAAYLAGFEADWRDAYPGINALTLMELGDEADPRQAQIAPVVLYAATRKANSPRADYWDYATLLEVAVLARDEKAATGACDTALTALTVAWWGETTLRNLRFIREKRAGQGEDVAWILEIEAEIGKRVADSR